MPILRSALAMDENYLHPEGPQLDSSLFSVASPNLGVSGVIQDVLHGHCANSRAAAQASVNADVIVKVDV